MTQTNEINRYRTRVDYDKGRKMRSLIGRQIRDYIMDTIQPKDEDISDWRDLLDCDWVDSLHAEGVGGYKYKRLDNPDAQSMTDEMFVTLCRMVDVEDNLTVLYWE